MNAFARVILITGIAGVGGTGMGGLASLVIRRDSSRLVSLLLSFAGGIMLAVVCFDMITGALYSREALGYSDILLVMSNILVGYLAVWILNRLIEDTVSPELDHTDRQHTETVGKQSKSGSYRYYMGMEDKRSSGVKYRLFVAGIVMACAIALHNIPEGMVIGASYAGEASGSVSEGSGIVMAVVIGLHNIPEGMAVAVPLIAGGTRRWEAVFMTALSGLPTTIGAVIGFCLGTMSPLWLSFSLSFASGAMLYVVFGELLPESTHMWRSRLPAFAVLLGLLVGLFIIHI